MSLTFVFLLGMKNSVPGLSLEHLVLQRVRADLLGPSAKSDLRYGPGKAILDETGTYVFTAQARYNLKTRAVGPYRSLVPFTGPRDNPIGYGAMVCNWSVGMYPDLNKYMLQEVKRVFHSDNGASLWHQSDAWKASSASTFGRMWMSGSKPGFNAYLNSLHSHMLFKTAMGTDGRSYALLRTKGGYTRPSKNAGQESPPRSGSGDIALGRLGSSDLIIRPFPKHVIKDSYVDLEPFHYDQNRRMVLSKQTTTTETKLALSYIGPGTVSTRYLELPPLARLRQAGYPIYHASGAWITPRKGNILLQMWSGGPGKVPSLWLYDFEKARWIKVGNVNVRAWSGSNRLFLIDGRSQTDPAWLIRLNE